MVRTGMRILLLAAIGTALVYGSVQAGGQKKGEAGKDAPKEQRTVSPATKAVKRLQAAFEMAAYGREHKAPEALIAAARVIGTTATEKGESKEAKVAKAETYNGQEEAEALLKEAEKLAGDSEGVKSLIVEARKDIREGKRGPADGRPRTYSGVFYSPNNPYDTYQVFLRGGESTSVTLLSHTGTDLDLEVRDRNGQVIARDNGTNPNAYATFYVPFDADYQVRVINFNPNAQSRYTLFVR